MASPAARAGAAQDAAQAPTPLDAQLFGDIRFRYEHARDGGRPLDASAATLRLRAGLEVSLEDGLTGLAEFEGAEAFVDAYDDLIGPPENRAVVADPAFAELNRLYVRMSPLKGASITVGRQYLSLDDERFIGRVAFRQNDQTLDAVRLEAALPLGLDVEAAYIWSVNRILSDRNPNGRFRGDSAVINASLRTPVGRIAGFYYALDLETGPRTAPDASASSKTVGVRWEGRSAAFDPAVLRWEGSYARQTEFADAPLPYAADYWLGAASAEIGRLTFGGRFELLGRGGARAFQTPLATLHAFQGAADVFLTTPSEGVRETALRIDWRAGEIGPFTSVAAFASGHQFKDASGTRLFGREMNAGLKGSFRGVGLAVKVARYEASSFGEDVRRIWLSAERAF
ncbi:MAG: alginate export family protein [Parvularculaceae bacterium]|nr:alginate export family protein [Parvularculaceae bacterium]